LNEAALAIGISDGVRAQELDRDRSLQPGVDRAVDHAHPTLSRLGFNPVVAERLSDHLDFRNRGHDSRAAGPRGSGAILRHGPRDRALARRLGVVGVLRISRRCEQIDIAMWPWLY
jgi:hypothetical protein